LPDLPKHAAADKTPFDLREHVSNFHQHVEWRVVFLAITMSLVAFGYGALTSFSALFADSLGVTPRGLFLIAMAVTMLGGRLVIGRQVDRIGHRRVLLPSLVACAIGMAVTAMANGPVVLAIGGGLFGLGFGLMWPAFTALVLGFSGPAKSGAAYGAMIAAFDTGIGTGSSALGSIVAKFGYRPAFGFAALLAALAAPYFLLVEKRFTK
jgi:MFS family permease